jgi:hypothetical protein
MIRTQPHKHISRIDRTAPAGITVRALPQIDATAVGDVSGIYDLIARAGPVTGIELAELLQLHLGYVQPWLQWQAATGYLHRDEFGRYAPWCAWPRAGF